jgi:hypothetical protein
MESKRWFPTKGGMTNVSNPRSERCTPSMRWLFQNGPLDEEDRRKIQLQEGPLSDPTLCRLTSDRS